MGVWFPCFKFNGSAWGDTLSDTTGLWPTSDSGLPSSNASGCPCGHSSSDFLLFLPYLSPPFDHAVLTILLLQAAGVFVALTIHLESRMEVLLEIILFTHGSRLNTIFVARMSIRLSFRSDVRVELSQRWKSVVSEWVARTHLAYCIDNGCYGADHHCHGIMQFSFTAKRILGELFSPAKLRLSPQKP